MRKPWPQMLIWTIFLAVLMLWSAGTVAFPGGWMFILLFGGGGSAITGWMARHSPHLLRERLAWPDREGQKPWDRVFLAVFIVIFFVWLAFMSWDAGRTGFAAVPLWLQVLGCLAVMAYGFGAWLVFRENAFAAPAVKIQEGQRVIDTGPYAVVRHPMYASALLLFLGLPLLLGSWWGLAFCALFIPGLAWRALREEETLRRELPGYAEYTERVHCRFIPRVW